MIRIMTIAVTAALTSGCIATRDYVDKTIDPLTGRVAKTESRLDDHDKGLATLNTQIGAVDKKVGTLDGRVAASDKRIGTVEAKADKALRDLDHLRLTRTLVVEMKDGATFANGAVGLTRKTRKDIEDFLGAKSALGENPNGIPRIVVAGHADSRGTSDVNYRLAQRRAETVTRYLITSGQVDPVHIQTVSYGETSPREDNKTRGGRASNRRVEILVYQDNVTVAPDEVKRP